MKRFSLLVFCVLLYCGFASANTIHWITFIDTKDPNVGSFDIYGRKFLYSQWVNKVNAALAQCGYSAKTYDFYDNETSPENCKRIVENFRCDSNDIVVFYYMGHGGRAYKDKSIFPQMLLAQEDDSKCIPLTWVHETLSNSQPRLLLTIGMCCNSFAPGMTPKESIAFYPNNNIAQYSIDEMQSIRKLFLENRGNVIVSSSSAGQISIAPPYISGLDHPMDIFTFKLVSDFNRYVKESNNPSWTVLLSRVQADVNNFTLGVGVNQTPQYIVDVRKSLPPSIDDRNNGNDNDNKNKEGDDIAQEMTKVFDNLISTRVPLADRMRRASILRSKFSENAVVKILAEDTDFVVDKMSIYDFLSIVSTSKAYFKIIVCDVKSANGFFEEIKVREYIMKK